MAHICHALACQRRCPPAHLMCATCWRSRRHKADIRPSTADAATPATEVPKASPRPFTGAVRAAT